MAGEWTGRRVWPAATLVVGICTLMLASRQLGEQGRAELLGDGLPASYQSSVKDLASVDASHGAHPSLKDTAFLAQLSSVLSSKSSGVDVPQSSALKRTQVLEMRDLSAAPHQAARMTSLTDTNSVARGHAGMGWCHCADEAGCECSHSTGGSLRPQGAKAVSLAMNCCQCDGSQVSMPAVPCADCHECGSKAFSPYYNPYGVRKSQRKTPILRQQQQRVWSAKDNEGHEAFWKDAERKGEPTDGMRTLNHIIAGARHFVRPPPTKDVYKVIKKTVVHKDPLVAAS